MTIESSIINLLNTVKFPSLNLTGRELGFSYKVSLEANFLTVEVIAGIPVLLFEKEIKECLRQSLLENNFNYSLEINVLQYIKAHKTQLPGKGLRGVKNTIAVASGKGGVGKSTVTVNLATALAKLGAKVGILDADIYGPSIPMMLGKTEPVQVKDDKYLPVEAHGIQAMSIGYLTKDAEALIWRGPMLAKSLIQMLDITLWEDLDYLFIDLPPGTGDIQLTLVQKIPLAGAIIVTTPQNVATLDAQKALHMFKKTGIEVLGLVENMSTHQCSQCGHTEAIFGEGGALSLCKTHHTVLLGQLPLDSRIREQCDEGEPSAIQTTDDLSHVFMNTAIRSSVELAKRPINYADKFPPIVVE